MRGNKRETYAREVKLQLEHTQQRPEYIAGTRSSRSVQRSEDTCSHEGAQPWWDCGKIITKNQAVFPPPPLTPLGEVGGGGVGRGSEKSCDAGTGVYAMEVH